MDSHNPYRKVIRHSFFSNLALYEKTKAQGGQIACQRHTANKWHVLGLALQLSVS